MLCLKRINQPNKDLEHLIKKLDAELAKRDGEEHIFYDQFNSIHSLCHFVIAYENDVAVACGALKPLDAICMEVKRMYTLPSHRGKRIAGKVLSDLESWAAELGFKKIRLETGLRQLEAIGLYNNYGYRIIPNYGQYIGVTNSLCFEKEIQ